MIRIAARRPAGSAAGGPTPDRLADLQAATVALSGALRGMSLLGCDPDPPDYPLDEAAGVWADENYLYIEARLSDDLGTCIDVSTCGRTLMVRIARREDHD